MGGGGFRFGPRPLPLSSGPSGRWCIPPPYFFGVGMYQVIFDLCGLVGGFVFARAFVSGFAAGVLL